MSLIMGEIELYKRKDTYMTNLENDDANYFKYVK